MHLTTMTMEEHLPQQRSASTARPACSECQRRKQKCNREFPCNHCKKRNVAEKCRFTTVLDERIPVDRRRPGIRQEPPAPIAPVETVRYYNGDGEEDDDIEYDDDNEDANLEALGYSAAHFLSISNPNQEKKPKAGPKQYYRDPADCSQLEHALQVLPPRPYTDSLIQNFVNNVNFHHYIVHPTTFLEEYDQWWKDKAQGKPLGLPWTSLLLMVCACSAQHPDSKLQEKLQRDYGETTQKLSEKYHNAGRNLYNTIPVGNSHLYTVQQLLHSAYWFKSEARYADCWHALTAGIREALELGIHQESMVSPASEFDREMRRRAWCVLTTWDWQITSLLSRPLIFDPQREQRQGRDVQLPSLNFEEYRTSPFLSTRLQAEIIWDLSLRFGRPSSLTTIDEAKNYKATVEAWIKRLPQPYTFENPDKSMDLMWPWIALHRHRIYTTSLSMVLDPLRPYLARSLTQRSPPEELSLRREGVKYSLILLNKLFEFFTFKHAKDAKVHTIIFQIFDTATLLCSAILHDGDQTLPRRDDCLRMIDYALKLLTKLHTAIPSARKPYEILNRLSKKMSKQTQGVVDNHNRKRAKMAGTPQTTTLTNTSTTNTSPVANTSPGPQTSPVTYPSPGSHHSPAYSSPASHNSPIAHNSPGPYPPSGVSPPASHHHQVINEPMSNMMQPNDPWQGGRQPNMQPIQSSSPQYYLGGVGSAFVPSPLSAVSSVEGSFILSTSPGAPMNVPATTAMNYTGMMMASEEPYQDVNFGNITEDDLGALAGLWDYNSLNLGYVAPYSGP